MECIIASIVRDSFLKKEVSIASSSDMILVSCTLRIYQKPQKKPQALYLSTSNFQKNNIEASPLSMVTHSPDSLHSIPVHMGLNIEY